MLQQPGQDKKPKAHRHRKKLIKEKPIVAENAHDALTDGFSFSSLCLAADHSLSAGEPEPVTQQPAPLLQYLQQEAFHSGKYADITLVAFDQTFRLHRILLAQSPAIARLLFLTENEMESGPRPRLSLTFPYFPLVTRESFSICLAHLYGSPLPLEAVQRACESSNSNAHLLSMISTIEALKLPCETLAPFLNLLRRRIAENNVIETMAFSVQALAILKAEKETLERTALFTAVYDDCWLFLAHGLPIALGLVLPNQYRAPPVLHSFLSLLKWTHPLSSSTFMLNANVLEGLSAIHEFLQKCPPITTPLAPGEGRKRLLEIYADLPFALLKEVIENGLEIGTEFEKFTFVKQVVEARVLRCAVYSKKGEHYFVQRFDEFPEGFQVKSRESVVLLFDGDRKGKVSMVEQAVRKLASH